MCQLQSTDGNNHPDDANRIEKQAHIAYSQGQYQDAACLYQQALEMRRHLYPGDHPDVASSLYNLAAIYEVLQRYQEAEQLYQQALEMRKLLYQHGLKMRGISSNYPNKFKRIEENAKRIEENAKRIEEKGKRIENDAHNNYSQGEYQEAEHLFQKVLQIRKGLYPYDHPDLASGINNVAAIYEVLKRSEAQPLYQQASKMRKRLDGDDQP